MPPVPQDLFRNAVHSGILFALLTALSFGGQTTLAALYYQDGGNVLTMLMFRFGFTVAALLVLIRGGPWRPPTGRRFAGVLAVGATWTIGTACYLGSVHYIAVGVAALILYTFPVMVLIMSLAARELRSTAALWVVFLAAFGGLAIMLLPSVAQFNHTGLLLAFGAALLFAATFFIGARVSPGSPARTTALWVTLTGLVVTAPVVYWNDALALPRSGGGWLWLGAATLLYLAAVLCQFSALARAHAAQVSMVMNLEPIVSVALATWVLGERLSPLQWLGAAAVLGALLLSQRVLQKSAPGTPPGRQRPAMALRNPNVTRATASQDRAPPQRKTGARHGTGAAILFPRGRGGRCAPFGR